MRITRWNSNTGVGCAYSYTLTVTREPTASPAAHHYHSTSTARRDMMAAMGDVPVCAVVTCYQLNSGDVPARCGSRAVRATPASIAGMTIDPVHFVSCDVCHAVVLHVGVKGTDEIKSARLTPNDPRAKLLCEITSADASAAWGKPMDGPARVVGIVNVHEAANMSEVGCMCFNCGAGPR